MEKAVRIVLAGVGGYGQVYLNKLLKEHPDLPAELVAGVDPYAKNSSMYPALQAAGIPIFDTLEQFYQENQADLAILATPIHFHKPQSILCMERGSHVLCEKPVCAVIDDVQAMINARERTGRILAIGYQWSFSTAIQGLKRDVLAGRYGRARRMKTLVLWPRDFAYYRRGSGWAGSRKTKDGDWILDSVASNATAHYLHNMLYVAGPQIDRSAAVREIEVETYRANKIETYDTCAMRLHTPEDVEMLYLVSHAVAEEQVRGPEFIFEFEKGTATAAMEHGEVVVRGHMADGEEIYYGEPNADATWKLNWMVDAILTGKPIPCGPEAASEHTKCVNRVSELIPETPLFPEERMIRTDTRAYCKGLNEVLGRCYDEWRLPGELGIAGFGPAKKGGMAANYIHFSGI